MEVPSNVHGEAWAMVESSRDQTHKVKYKRTRGACRECGAHVTCKTVLQICLSAKNVDVDVFKGHDTSNT